MGYYKMKSRLHLVRNDLLLIEEITSHYDPVNPDPGTGNKGYLEALPEIKGIIERIEHNLTERLLIQNAMEMVKRHHKQAREAGQE